MIVHGAKVAVRTLTQLRLAKMRTSEKLFFIFYVVLQILLYVSEI